MLWLAPIHRTRLCLQVRIGMTLNPEMNNIGRSSIGPDLELG